MRNFLRATTGSGRATLIRWSIGLGLILLIAGLQLAWPAVGSGLNEWLVTRSARFASSYLEAAGVFHLLAESEIRVPGQRFEAAELHRFLTTWFSVLGFAAAYLIVVRRRLVRSVVFIASLPMWCVLAAAATMFAAVQTRERWPLEFDSQWVLAAHTGFLLLVVLAFDQLLGVLWFVGRFIGFVVIRVVGLLLGSFALAGAQFWRLSSDSKATRRRASWTNRARAMLRGPGLHRFLRGSQQQQFFSALWSRRKRRKKTEPAAAAATAPLKPAAEPGSETKSSKRSRRKQPLWARDWRSKLRARPALRIALALPAAALLLAAGFGQLRWSQLIRGELIPRYQRAASVAFDRRDFDAAELYYRKLQQLDKKSAEAIYGQALVAETTGDRARASQLMRQIATPDEPGYAPAHIWLAKSLMADQEGIEPTRVKEYQNHLTLAIEAGRDQFEAHELLGLLMQSTGRYRQAIYHLKAAVSNRPQLSLNLASCFAARQMFDEAKLAATQAAEHFERATRDEPHVSEHRIGWANALVFLTDFERAEAVLTEGLAGAYAHRFRTALVRTYLVWFDSLAAQSSPNEAQLLEIGGKGLQLEPDNEPLLRRVAVLVYFGELPEERRGMLPPIHTKIAASPATLVALGSEFTKRKQYPQAVAMLKLALQLEPQAHEIMNNLAWNLLLTNRKQDLQMALRLSTEAIDRQPQNPHLRDTRGQILVKLGRYREALADLEQALRFMGSNTRLHLALATVYEQLGMHKLAAKHKQLAAPTGD